MLIRFMMNLQSLSDLRAWYPTLNIVDGKRLNDASKSEIAGFCNR